MLFNVHVGVSSLVTVGAGDEVSTLVLRRSPELRPDQGECAELDLGSSLRNLTGLTSTHPHTGEVRRSCGASPVPAHANHLYAGRKTRRERRPESPPSSFVPLDQLDPQLFRQFLGVDRLVDRESAQASRTERIRCPPLAGTLRSCPTTLVARRQRARCRVVVRGHRGARCSFESEYSEPGGRVSTARDQYHRSGARPEHRLSRRVEPGGVPRLVRRVQVARRG